MLLAVTDGGIILFKVMGDKTVLPRQVMLYRSLVKTVFLAG
jgi:TetR/AcrR family transcriptional regulator, transcriptional repressor for nem operon